MCLSYGWISKRSCHQMGIGMRRRSLGRFSLLWPVGLNRAVPIMSSCQTQGWVFGYILIILIKLIIATPPNLP